MDVVDRFDVIETVSTGTLDVTMRARSRVDGRPVMLKRLRKRPPLIELELDRLQNEALTINRELGASISGITHVGARDGYVLMAAELCSGQSMRALVESSSVDPEDVVVCLRHLAQTMDRAHQVGIFHGNLKPENVFFSVTKGEAIRVLDFGVVRCLERLHSRERVAIGTPGYLPKYRLQSRSADEHSDRFAFAVLAFEMLTGLRPDEHAQSDALELLLPPSLRDNGVRRALADTFAIALSDRSEAFSSLDELVKQIDDVLGAIPSAQRAWHIPRAATCAKLSALPLERREGEQPTLVLPNAGEEQRTTVFVPPPTTAVRAMTDRVGWRKLAMLLLVGGVALGGGPVLLLLPASRAAVTQASPPARASETATAAVTAAHSATAPASAEAQKHDARRVQAGRLRIEAAPALDVSIEGVPMGRTPLVLAGLAPGRYQTTFSDTRLNVRRRRTVTVPNHGEQVYKFELESGKLSIKADEPVQVSIDDQEVGTTPIAPLQLCEGDHSLSLTRGGRTVRQVLKIEANTFHVIDAARELEGESEEG
jgi:serine/threonine-protein kinase